MAYNVMAREASSPVLTMMWFAHTYTTGWITARVSGERPIVASPSSKATHCTLSRRCLLISLGQTRRGSQYPANTAASGMTGMMSMMQAMNWNKQASRPHGSFVLDVSMATAVNRVATMPSGQRRLMVEILACSEGLTDCGDPQWPSVVGHDRIIEGFHPQQEACLGGERL